MMKYFYELARMSAKIAGEPVKADWLFLQWAHETNGFTSELCTKYHNFGGLTQLIPNDLPQPDGELYYMSFASDTDFVVYFGTYLTYYRPDGLYGSETLADYCYFLKEGGYYGATYQEYLSGCESWRVFIP